MRIAFTTLGCKVNQYETEILKELFTTRGYEVVSPTDVAEVYVLNSCTVTASGDKKTRQLLRRMGRQNPAALLCLTGCLPQAYPDTAAALPEAHVITGSYNRRSLPDAVERALTTGDRVIDVTPHRPGEAFETMSATAMDGKTRAFVKIEDGCDRYCAYCIIPTARGPVRSMPLKDLESQLLTLSTAGYREVVLAGINLSLYGRDFGARLTDAVALADKIPGIDRIRLGSVEPELLTPVDIKTLAHSQKLCPQFHLALQSGCDATLARMNRHYTTAQYREIAERFRTAFPGAAITTDIMVGFPGETEEEFSQTAAFLESLGLAKAHVFSYSPRPGTAAATMGGQVQPGEKERRSAILTQITDRTRLAFFQHQVGRVEPVLFEAKTKADSVEGHTPNYTPITVPCPQNLRGQILPVRLTGAGQSGCVGEFVVPITP